MGLPLKACLQGREVGPREHSEVHGSNTSQYSNKSVYFANTNIPWRDRSAGVLAKTGLQQAHKAEPLTFDVIKFTSLRSFLGENHRAFCLAHHLHHTSSSKLLQN